MKQEGMAGSIQVDLDDFMGKEFVTFRKTKNYSEVQYSTKYSFVNFVNSHFTRRQKDITNQMDQVEVAKRIAQARPSVILNIDNEFITMKLMEDIKSKFEFAITMSRVLPEQCQLAP
jgi:hypothetical protein